MSFNWNTPAAASSGEAPSGGNQTLNFDYFGYATRSSNMRWIPIKDRYNNVTREAINTTGTTVSRMVKALPDFPQVTNYAANFSPALNSTNDVVCSACVIGEYYFIGTLGNNSSTPGKLYYGKMSDPDTGTLSATLVWSTSINARGVYVVNFNDKFVVAAGGRQIVKFYPDGGQGYLVNMSNNYVPISACSMPNWIMAIGNADGYSNPMVLFWKIGETAGQSISTINWTSTANLSVMPQFVNYSYAAKTLVISGQAGQSNSSAYQTRVITRIEQTPDLSNFMSLDYKPWPMTGDRVVKNSDSGSGIYNGFPYGNYGLRACVLVEGVFVMVGRKEASWGPASTTWCWWISYDGFRWFVIPWGTEMVAAHTACFWKGTMVIQAESTIQWIKINDSNGNPASAEGRSVISTFPSFNFLWENKTE